MAILSYKPKTGNIWTLYGEGEIIVEEGFYQPKSATEGTIYMLLDQQEIKGKDSSVKGVDGKASEVSIPWPIQAKFEVPADGNTVQRAVVSLFTQVLPDCASGFSGELNLSNTRSANRVRDNDTSSRAFDLGGGFCNIKPIELTTQFDTTTATGSGSYKGKAYKSAQETAEERAKILCQLLDKEYVSLYMAYVDTIGYYETMGMTIPTPIEFLKSLLGDK